MAIRADIILGVRNAIAQRGIADTRRKLQGLRRDISGAFSGALLGGGLIATLAAVTDKFDRIGKLAARGVGGVEFFQRLSFAAEQSGTNVEGVANLLRDLNKNLGEANSSPAIAEAFAALNLEVAELASLSPEERFFVFADAVKAAEGDTVKFAAALKVGGRSVSDLLPLLKEGSAGIQELGGQINTLSEGQIAKIEAFNDQVNLIKTQFLTLAGTVIPGFLEVTKLALSILIGQTVAWGKTIGFVGKSLVDLGQLNFDGIKQNFRELRAEISGIGASILEQGAATSDAFGLTGGASAAESQRAAVEAVVAKEAELSDLRKASDDERRKSLAESKAAEEGVLAVKKKELDLDAELNRVRRDAAQEKLSLAEQLQAVDEQQSQARAGIAGGGDAEEFGRSIVDLEQQKIDLVNEAGDRREANAERILDLEQQRLDLANETSAVQVDGLRQIGGGAANVNYAANLTLPVNNSAEIAKLDQQITRLTNIEEALKNLELDFEIPVAEFGS